MAEKDNPAKKPRGRKGFGTPSLEKHCTATRSEISEIIAHSAYWLGRTRVKDADEMADRLNEFFEHCNETGEIPSVEKLALALGTNAAGLYSMENGRTGADEEMRSMIKQAKAILAGIDAELVARRKIPETTYIFRSKNYYGLRDQQELIVAPKDPMGEPPQDPATLAQKYQESLPGPKKTIELTEATAVEEPATID